VKVKQVTLMEKTDPQVRRNLLQTLGLEGTVVDRRGGEHPWVVQLAGYLDGDTYEYTDDELELLPLTWEQLTERQQGFIEGVLATSKWSRSAQNFNDWWRELNGRMRAMFDFKFDVHLTSEEMADILSNFELPEDKP